jgi:hypothetical protein
MAERHITTAFVHRQTPAMMANTDLRAVWWRILERIGRIPAGRLVNQIRQVSKE